METRHEVTEWKQAEAALRNSLAACDRAVNELADQKLALDQHATVAVTDVMGTITYVNDECCLFSQYSKDELIGKNYRVLNSGHHSREFFTEMYDAISNGRVWQGEIKKVAKDGSSYWEDTTIVPFVDADGRPWQYLAIGKNTTGSKLAAEAHAQSEKGLGRTVEELKHPNEELRHLVYVASHDLQEPLRMVACHAQLLARRYKGQLDPDADESIAFVIDGCNRMKALILALSAYSSVEINGESKHEVPAEDALRESLENLCATIKQSSAVVTYDSLPSISINHAQLVQIFQNLVGNAIKYRSARAPVIHISAAKNSSNEWMFAVRDNGMGIAPRHFERIFLFFQRLHGPEEFEGAGIGLAICKKIVERQGGRIWVESQPGEGSVFYFTLPSSVALQNGESIEQGRAIHKDPALLMHGNERLK